MHLDVLPKCMCQLSKESWARWRKWNVPALRQGAQTRPLAHFWPQNVWLFYQQWLAPGALSGRKSLPQGIFLLAYCHDPAFSGGPETIWEHQKVSLYTSYRTRRGWEDMLGVRLREQQELPLLGLCPFRCVHISLCYMDTASETGIYVGFWETWSKQKTTQIIPLLD